VVEDIVVRPLSSMPSMRSFWVPVAKAMRASGGVMSKVITTLNLSVLLRYF